MSKNKLLKILLPSIALTFGSQANAYTLHEAVTHTLATSPDFLIAANTRDTIDKDLRGAYADYLPVLDLTAGWGEQYTNNPTTRFQNPLVGGSTSLAQEGTQNLTRTEFGLIATQMIFDGFGVYHNVAGKKARVKAESWRVNGAAQDAVMGAVQAYLEVLLRRELVGLNRDNLNVHETIFGQIHKRSEGGIGRKADMDQAEGRVALARTNLMAEEANLNDAETEFLRKVGIPVPSHLVRPEHPHGFPSSELVAIETGLKRNPILIASIEDTNVTREAYRGARAPFMPRLDLQLGMNRNHNIDGSPGDSDDNTAMLRVRWNLFSGGKDLAKICENAYRMQEAIEVQRRAHRQVIESVRLAWSTHQTAARQLRYFREHVEASVRTTSAYEKQFNIGQRTLLDVLDSQNELFGARTALANGRHIELLSIYKVLQAMGCLTDDLGLQLPRQAEPRPTGVMAGAFGFFERNSSLFD